MKKRICAIFLILVCLTLSLSSCDFSFSTEAINEADENAKLFLEAWASRDEDAMFDCLYPGVTTRENFGKTMEEMTAYCPLTKDYQAERISFNVSVSFGKDKQENVQAIYELNFGESEFVLLTYYVKTSDASGFTSFRIVTRAEYEAASTSD